MKKFTIAFIGMLSFGVLVHSAEPDRVADGDRKQEVSQWSSLNKQQRANKAGLLLHLIYELSDKNILDNVSQIKFSLESYPEIVDEQHWRMYPIGDPAKAREAYGPYVSIQELLSSRSGLSQSIPVPFSSDPFHRVSVLGGFYPLEFLAYWLGVQNVSECAELDQIRGLFRNIAQNDQNAQHRLRALNIGITLFSSFVVDVLLKAGTQVIDQSKCLENVVAACKRNTEEMDFLDSEMKRIEELIALEKAVVAIQKRQEGLGRGRSKRGSVKEGIELQHMTSLRESDFNKAFNRYRVTMSSEYGMWGRVLYEPISVQKLMDEARRKKECLLQRRDSALGIAKLLFAARADVSGISKIKYCDLYGCSTCSFLAGEAASSLSDEVSS